MSLVKNLPTQRERLGKKIGQENQLMKNLQNFNEKIWEENQKITDIIDEKTFQPGLRTGKEKPNVCGKRRDFGWGGTLVKKRLGRNKVLFSSQ